MDPTAGLPARGDRPPGLSVGQARTPAATPAPIPGRRRTCIPDCRAGHRGPWSPAVSLSSLQFSALSEDTLLVTVGDSPDRGTLRQVRALEAALDAQPLPGLREIVTSFTTLAVIFEPLAVTRATPSERSPLAAVARWVKACAHDARPVPDALLHRVKVPVCYGGDFGPDLPAVAAHARLSADEVVERHSAHEYEVAAVGFAPGFPYLLGLDARLQMPRRETPRVRVPGGSVGIGGTQTGIYPDDGPGGWQLIGRTPWRVFDARHEPPARLAAGDRVRFFAIDEAEFSRLAAGGEER